MPIVSLHDDIDRRARKLHVLHAPRLHCERGCSACCVDDLTVFEVEAARIRVANPELLATGLPHATGACAFLDAEGACRVYDERPYVCRTQGLPLRWVEGEVELRDICPLNEGLSEQEAVELLPIDACWTLGPIEEELARLDLVAVVPTARLLLRSMFALAPLT